MVKAMEREIQEIHDLRRKGLTVLALRKFILASKKHRRAWELSQKHGKKQISQWEEFFHLVQNLDEGCHETRSQSAYYLGKMGEEAKEAIPFLLKALSNHDPYVRSNVIYALGEIRSEAPLVIPALLKILEENNSAYEVRKATVIALGKFGTSAIQAISLLTRMLYDKNVYIRSSVAYVLGEFGESACEAIPALIKALEDESYDVREHVSEALGKMGGEAKIAIPALMRSMHDESEEVCLSAAKALRRIRHYASC